MDDVLRGHVDFHHLADRHIGRVVDAEQANVSRLQFLVLLDERIEREAALGFRIPVIPVPLRGRHLESHVRRRNDELISQQPERGNCYHYENQRRDHSPSDLERPVMRQPRGGWVRPLVKADDNVSKQREHQNRNADRDRQENRVVEPFNVGLNRRVRWKKANLPRRRRANDRRFRRAEQTNWSQVRLCPVEKQTTFRPSTPASTARLASARCVLRKAPQPRQLFIDCDDTPHR